MKNQVVIITGASKGIGKGIALAFASVGAKLLLIGRDEEALKKVTNEIGNNAIFLKAMSVSKKTWKKWPV